MEKYLIINADDFGLSPGVNTGIIHAFVDGTISSVSIMANMPGFDHAVQMAHKNSKLGVGLHFNLTYGKPISPPFKVPSLIDHRARFLRQSSLWKVGDIERELTAQWEKLLASGICPTHLDSHHHIQKFKFVWDSMASLALDQHIPMRRVTTASSGSRPSSADYLIADTYFDHDGLCRLLKRLQRLKSGVTELVCHPGYVDEILLKTSSWTYVRETELQVFLDPRVKLALRQYNIRLIDYSQFQEFR